MALRMTEEEFAALQARNRRRSTFSIEQKEIRVEVDGIKFDSQHEATIYQELMLRVRAGELKAVLRQVSFDLPGDIRYVADFVTIAPDMHVEGVYDAKSPATKANRVYINKKKQMKACWGIEIREV